MARHNRDARGVDQHGELWHVSYQPDWLRRIKISRMLPDGRRRSTLSLFRNPAEKAKSRPGKVIRTRVRAADGSADFQVSLEDPDGVVEQIEVTTRRERNAKDETIRFVLEGGLPPAG